LEAENVQRFTRMGRPQTNGKAERVIRTLMDGWHTQTPFNSSAHRKQELRRWVNWYNLMKPHKSLDGETPMEQLIDYFNPQTV